MRLRVDRAELSELARLATPVILARIGIMVMGLTDAVVVGRYSSQELAFHALGWAPTSIILTTAVGLLAGVQVKTAQRLGEGQPDAVGAVLRRGLIYAFWIGVASTLLLALAGPAFLHVLRLDPVLADGSGRALQVFAVSMVPYLLSVALSLWLEALRRPAAGMIIMWLANAVNLALNLWLVPGGFGVEAMGAVGSAWATFGARVFLLVALAVFVLRLPEARSLGVFRRAPRDRAAEREQRRIGYGAGSSYFVEVAAFAGMNVVAGWLGALEVAAWAIVLNVTAIVFMVPLGLSAATGVMVGRAWGAGDRQGVVRAAELSFIVTVAITALMGLLIWPTAGLIAGAYASEPALAAAAAAALVLAPLFFIPDGLQAVAAQALRARADVLVPSVMHVISYAAVMLPLGWWLAHPAGLGLSGVMAAVIVASFLSAALLLARFVQLSRRNSSTAGTLAVDRR